MERRFTATLFDSQFFTNFIIIFILLGLSAFFAGIESSFFSMDWLKIKRLAKTGNKSAKLADWLRSRPKELVITFLIGNELINITASAIATSLAIKYLGEKYVFVAVIVMTILILTFGEITPKTIGSYFPEKYALFASRPFYLFYIVATPFRFIFTKIATALLKKFGLELPIESHKISEEDLKTILAIGREQGIFTKEEEEIIEATLELDDTTVSEIMTPRRDIFALESGLTVKEVLEQTKDKDYSRIPIYKENLDNIIGILYLKDIIFLKFKGKENDVIDNYLRKPFFIPEFKPLISLLKEFEETKNHLAIVIDEHGTVVGLITFQDILEFLVGEIPEEYETEEMYIKEINKNKWEVSGRLDIETFREEIGIPLPEDYEYDTVAGFILDYLKKIPKEGEVFEYKGFRFTIKKVENNRIISVIVEKITTNENQEEVLND